MVSKIVVSICTALIAFASSSQVTLPKESSDSLNFKIYFTDGFRNSVVSAEINGSRVLKDVNLNSSPGYGLTGQEITIRLEKKRCRKVLIVQSSQGVFTIKAKKEIRLKLYSDAPEFEYVLDKSKKFFVIYRRGMEYYVSTYTEQPGFE